ncbi:MAG: hypothetical protein WAQ24_01775, partial [Candidatus Saccharimonadales bacterium]
PKTFCCQKALEPKPGHNSSSWSDIDRFYNRHENSSLAYCHWQHTNSSNNSCRLTEVVKPDNI